MFELCSLTSAVVC